MPDNPHVSVLMPVYNCERYIAHAVQSILTQTMSAFELLLIDDGSTDSTLRVLRRFEAADQRIRLVVRENRGLISSLNEGLAMARGELIARMDGDDISLPNRLARQVHFLNEHQECVVVGCNIQVVDAEGFPICFQDYPSDHESIVATCLHGYGGIPHPGAMFRRRVVQTIGGYREGYVAAEDLDLWLRLAEVGVLSNLPDVLLTYRVHLQGVSIQRMNLQVQNAYNAVTDACHRRNSCPPDPELFRKGATAGGSEIVLAGWCHLALRDNNLRSAMTLAASMVRSKPLGLQPYLHLFKVIIASVENPIHQRILGKFPGATERAAKAKAALERRHLLHGDGQHREALLSAWQSVRLYPTLNKVFFLGGSAFRYTKSLCFQRAKNPMPSDFRSAQSRHKAAKTGNDEDV